MGRLAKQGMNSPKNRYLTFIIIPHSSAGGVYTFRIPTWVVLSSMLLAFICIVVVSSSVIYSSALSRRLLHYKMTLQVNEEQKRQIDYFSSQTLSLKKSIFELVDWENELRRMLGLAAKKSKIDLSTVASGRMQDNSDFNTTRKIANVVSDLNTAEDGIKERKESLEGLKEKVKYIRSRFAHTPSIWPAYGRIASVFGYRYMPWRGFHTGLDVSTWYGAPIRAAADGVVIYAGWKGGYGKAVMIDHGYGLVSLYGHCSKITVALGGNVKKGQIISYVGATGLATGPHVHYELRANGYLANPIGYLNLDIFTASRIWNK